MYGKGKDESFTDVVTKGGNQSWLIQQYEDIYKRKEQNIAFIYLNIKGFMNLNNRYGRNGADEILREVYDTINKNLLEYEYVARIYADHYNLLLHYDTEDSLLERVYQINMAVYQIEDTRVKDNLYVSMGIFMLPEDKTDFYAAQDKANICRIMCPRISYRNSTFEFYSDSYYEVFMKKFEIAEQTAQALKYKRFVPFLQPKVSLLTEKIVGAEVLLRWFDMDGQMIPLQEYLPLLDHNGYIRDVDLFIFEEVCKTMEHCLKIGEPMVPISFNISKAYFNTDSFVDDYLNVVKKYDIPCQFLEFELMESIAFYDTNRLIGTVERLKEAGFCCSLDDFGSGYSSFNVLVNIAVDTLKIDRQFFINQCGEKDKIVIETIIHLAKRLGIHTVAEGIEDKGTIEFLKSIGCDMVQGFYYYKPMPVPDFWALLSSIKTEPIYEKSY